MRDHGIAYGFTESAIHRLSLETLSPQIRSFVRKNPKLLHEDANMAWLLNRPEGENTVRRVRDTGHGKPTVDYNLLTSDRVFEGSQYRVIHPEADWKQDQFEYADDFKSDIDDDGTGSLAEAFTTWLMGFCEGSILYPTFELGSLAFFRSPGHQALMDHLTTLSTKLPQSPVDDVPVHSLSASMFLPKQSVWNFRKKMTRYATLQPTPAPVPAPMTGHMIPPTRRDVATAMEEQFALWDQLAEDITRQSDSPGLKSGNTVIDERNFALMRDSVEA